MKVAVTKEQQYPVSIGLYQPNQLIELDSQLSTAEKSWGPFKCKPRGEYRLRIIDLNYGDLILDSNGKDNLIVIDCSGQRGSSITVSLSDYKTDFKLIINPMIVKDYGKNLQSISEKEVITSLRFKLELTKKDEKFRNVSEEQCIAVRIEKPNPYLNFQFDFLQESVTYDPLQEQPIHIANLNIQHSMNLNCAPELATKFRLQVESEGVHYPQFITLKKDIEESNPIRRQGDVNVQGESSSALSYRVDNHVNGTWHLLQHIRCNQPTNVITLPVMLDMTKIANPKDDTQLFNLTLNGIFQGVLFNENFQKGFSQTASLVLNKNLQLNRLQVNCINDDNSTQEELLSNGTYNWGKRILSPNLVNELKVRVLNSAIVIDTEHPNACIVVRHHSQPHLSCETNRIVLKNNIQHSDYFVLKDYGGNTLQQLANENTIYRLYPAQTGRNTFVDLTLSIASNDIRDILESNDGKFSTPLETCFEFEYAIDLKGNTNWEQLPKELFKGSIRWEMEQAANPEWLSVDFGTSAIVASFDRNFQPERNSLLNLKANKQELLRRCYRDKPLRMKDESSEPEPFIPSIISLNSQENEGAFDKERTAEEYKKYSLWLSPSTGMMDIMLPCLKTLIGYKTLPNILTEGENRNFSYQMETDSEEELHLFKENSETDERGLALVNNILKEVYKQLFRHFICLPSNNPRNPNPVQSDKLHKLVLSVPNTFTPKHHALLKDIAKQIFPTLHSEYLQVVSESDAVACYYLALRDRFFEEEKTPFLTNERRNELNNKEHVLVFDMGAGTLDLTYFTKQVTPDGLTRIKMQGKLGVNKAGNYLDYLLGEILYDLLAKKCKKNKSSDVEQFKKWLEVDKDQRIADQTGKKECEKLKDYLKDTIKPLLNEDNAIIPAYEYDAFNFQFVTTQDVNLTMLDIRTHHLYSAYIKECTEQVLDNMVSLFGEKQETTDRLFQLTGSGESNLPIDVLVFSGRSTALYDIRIAVAEYISKHSSDKEVLCADLTTNAVTPIGAMTETTQNNNQNSLKTVVTSGSLIYADWVNRPKLFQFEGKKVFADYGVLIHKVRPDCWVWKPLITNKSSELPNRNGLYETPVLFKGETSVDVENCKEVIFVQSYSKDPAQDWTNDNKDMISEMAYHHIPNGDSGNRKLSINIDATNTMTCLIEGYGKISLEPHDDFQNKSLRKSLWPVAF